MQRYNNFSNPPNIRRSFFSRASPVRLTPIIYRSAQIAAPIILQCHIRQYLKPQQKRLPNNAPSIKTCSPLKAPQTPPKTRSFELRVQRYNDFLKPPNFQQTFFAKSHSSQTRYTKTRRLTRYRTRRKESSRSEGAEIGEVGDGVWVGV